MKKLTTTELKKINRNNILQFIYDQRRTSKQEIADHLYLSMPPVTQCLKELMETGLVEKNGYFESTGGRKAEGITFVAGAKVAIGVELLKERVQLVAINLYGEVLKHETIQESFVHGDEYYDKVCGFVLDFIRSLHIAQKRILGIGIVLQGLISRDGKQVYYGKILNCTGLTIDSFTKHLPYPCTMVHDAEAAANIELWHSPGMKDAIFFHVRGNLSGAIIVGGKFLKGIELKSGVFEHMTIVPGGKPCYCGKNGCMEVYCSLRALEQDPNEEAIADFFTHLREGEADVGRIWSEYLDHMATGIDNLHMVMDSDIILGGEIARYINTTDIAKLSSLVSERSAFPSRRKFIRKSKCSGIPYAKGGALPFIQSFFQAQAFDS